jgi:unsaturated rhamnogalacturonyl hydrolase
MGYYFDERQSMYARAGTGVREVLDAVSRRYVGANPPHPMTLRAYCARGIMMGPDYRYHADFAVLLPKAEAGQAAVAWTRLWAR